MTHDRSQRMAELNGQCRKARESYLFPTHSGCAVIRSMRVRERIITLAVFTPLRSVGFDGSEFAEYSHSGFLR